MKDSATVRVEAAIEVVRRATADNADLPALDDRQLAKVRSYLETLLLWRRRISLIATSDPLEVVENHILDSLQVAPWVGGRRRLADIGSGAGLPGIPLAIAAPHLNVVLVESRRRKASFLRAVRRETDLSNVEVFEGRAEDLAESFDVVISRALGPMRTFLDLAETLLLPGGLAIAMKSKAALSAPERHAAFEAPKVIAYDLAGDRRRLLLLYDRR